MRTRGLLLVLLFPATAALAQTLPYTAYPIDALPGSLGHWTPLGALSTGNSDESRSQHLILAPYLPGVASRIYALDVAAHMTGTVPYESLQISMCHTTATGLGQDFANNLSQPVTVYSATRFSIDWSTTGWHTIQLQTPFGYDGVRNLVIEIQKVVDRPNNPGVSHITHQMSTLPQRQDLPHPLFKDGAYKSGAATASIGLTYIGSPMLMRLTWVAPPTLTIDGSRASGESYFRLGAKVGLHAHGPENAVFLAFLDGVLAPKPLSLPAIVGNYWLPPQRVIVLGIGVIGPSRIGDLPFTLPNQPELVDAHLYFQSLIVDSWLGWTNVVDAIVAQ